MTEQARAKLNLSLDVLGRLPGGYHALLMVMESVELCDEIDITPRSDGAFTLRSDLAWLPCDGRNLMIRAARAFCAAAELPALGADLTLRKRIPVGAGMAGGSSDAAAVLRGLNALAGRPFDADGLRRIALEVGSDVPYCVCGGSALAEGRGERLTPLPEMPKCSVVVVKPSFSLSTAELFGRVDSRRSSTRPDTAGLRSALEAGDLPGVARRMFNVFEDVLPRSCGEIGEARGELLDLGALGAVMTGTGSAVFGLFDEEESAAQAASALRGQFEEVFLTRFTPPLEI